MKINCNAASLAEACLNVQRAAAQKSTLPTLECIMLQTNEHGVELSGYDLEMGINTVVDATVEREGGILLNAKTLCEILRHLPKAPVSIEADDKHICTIKCKETEFSLIGFPASEFPDMPIVMGGVPVVLPQCLLRDMIRQTIFAVSVDDSKMVHKGVKFEIESGEMKLIALDGYRLAIRRERIDYQGESISFIVPAKTLSEVIKFINDENGLISLSLGKRHIVFSINGYNIVSRLLEGDFLNYKSAVPEHHSATVKVRTRELIESIERISLVITEKFKIPMKCVFDNDSIRFSCSTTVGVANDKISATMEGERIEIGFNNRFLLDALRAADTDEVSIKLSGPLSPVIITPPQGDGFIFLVLPARLRNED
ncbi:MAG: DNA polymerase III subunit beta [Oscillospiraceae bacterium]|jgi:DNA polymerase-3 subunit beta|nr:DNA polymerase III subunit beta [Oscillospiraceae bacterium]